MNEERFQDLVEYVQSTSANPPEHLFSGGYEDWHCRARLARSLPRHHDFWKMIFFRPEGGGFSVERRKKAGIRSECPPSEVGDSAYRQRS